MHSRSRRFPLFIPFRRAGLGSLAEWPDVDSLRLLIAQRQERLADAERARSSEQRFELGPDADRFRAEFVFHPAVKWSVGTTYEHARKGRGRISDPFEPGDDPEPTFPSGVVETTDRVGVELGYQSLERIAAGLGAAFESAANVGNILGKDDDGWEFWVGVEFRI